MRISLEALLQALVGRGTELARSQPQDAAAKVPTSIRLKPGTKAFLEAQGQVLGLGTSGVIELILDGMAQVTQGEPRVRLETMRDRFLYLADVHGLDYPAIVSIMGDHGFTLSALGSGDRLLDLLRKPALEHWAKTFCVRTEWLTGATDTAVQPDLYDGRWYKGAYGFARRVAQLGLAHRGKVRVIFLRRRNADFERSFRSGEHEHFEHIGIVIEQTRTSPDMHEFRVYEICEFERWSYGPCRRDLKLLMAFFDHIRPIVSMDGREMDLPELEAVISGKTLAATVFRKHGVGQWFPDDYAAVWSEVQHEQGEWPRVLHNYVESKLHKLAFEISGRELEPRLLSAAQSWKL